MAFVDFEDLWGFQSPPLGAAERFKYNPLNALSGMGNGN